VAGPDRKQRLIGVAVGGVIVALAAIAAVVLLGESGGGNEIAADVLPDGGSYPDLEGSQGVAAAARAAGCELESYRATRRAPHSTDPDERIEWPTKPPAGGRHYQEWADDGSYERAPNINTLVHSLEHGRIVIWFKKGLPADARAALKAYYDDDTYQTILTPDESGSDYAVAATAWNAEPEPNGTGRLLGCPSYRAKVFAALEAFKQEHRSRGPENVP
jgi:hypothetical protein